MNDMKQNQCGYEHFTVAKHKELIEVYNELIKNKLD